MVFKPRGSTEPIISSSYYVPEVDIVAVVTNLGPVSSTVVLESESNLLILKLNDSNELVGIEVHNPKRESGEVWTELRPTSSKLLWFDATDYVESEFNARFDEAQGLCIVDVDSNPRIASYELGGSLRVALSDSGQLSGIEISGIVLKNPRLEEPSRG